MKRVMRKCTNAFFSLLDTVQTSAPSCKKMQEMSTCQKNVKKYGHLPPKEAEPSIPWNRVNVDLMGPFTVKIYDKKQQLLALTMIDPTTGWFEATQIKDDTAETVSAAFDETWLSRYPRPQYIGYDNGKEYKMYLKG